MSEVLERDNIESVLVGSGILADVDVRSIELLFKVDIGDGKDASQR
jgi:hypothetical protein